MAWQLTPQTPSQITPGTAQPAQPQQQINIPAGMPVVCVLVPHFGKISMEFVQSTYAPLMWMAHPNMVKTSRIARGILNLDTLRNDMVKSALDDKAITHFLWVDSDCIIEEPKDANDALFKLLSCNVPIVSGLYRAKKSKGIYPYAMWAKHPTAEYGYIDIPQWTGNFISVDAIGLGFCLCKREVFEKIPPPWFVWDKVVPSEDFAWCEKVRKAGYEIKVYTDVKLSHEGAMKVLCKDGAVHVLDV